MADTPTQPPHANDQGQDWRARTRDLNRRFMHQLAGTGVAGVKLYGPTDLEIVTRNSDYSGLLSAVQNSADVVRNGQRYRSPEEQTSPRHAEAGPEVIAAEAPEYLSTRQLASRLGVSYSHVRRLMTKDDFPKPYRLLGAVRHEWLAVEAYVHRHRIGNSPDEEVARDGKRRGRRPRTDD